MVSWTQLVHEFFEHQGGDWADKTAQWYAARLKVFIAFAESSGLAAGQLTAADLNRFNGYLRRAGLAFGTRQGTRTALKAFVRWRCRRFRLANPFDDPDYKRPRKERRVREMISLNHAQRMIRAAEKSNSLMGQRDAAIMRLLLTAGLRREEIIRLELGYLDLDSRELKVVGKFGHQRLVSLRVTTPTALKRWLAKRPETEGKSLFVTLYGRNPYRRLWPNAINDLLIRWRDAAGLPKISVSPHKWRRRFATELAKGQNPFALQLLLGHSDITTTNDYVISQPDTLRDLIDQYGPDVDDEPEEEGD
jgi:site-specific recombinase XerC